MPHILPITETQRTLPLSTTLLETWSLALVLDGVDSNGNVADMMTKALALPQQQPLLTLLQ